ncbi:hypothetical protein [Actinomycetospora aeridis]|uniref:Nucleoside 2-deoxyribosyltransferase n=1 Tax=Actinomycetospora aeridis TaxID=3129231 RepID=A0ABU8NEH5_9PSEU
MKAYVASPYGFAESTKTWYDTTLLPLIEEHVEVLDPWKVQPEGSGPETWLALGARHLDTIEHEADLVVACLDQEPPE